MLSGPKASCDALQLCICSILFHVAGANPHPVRHICLAWPHYFLLICHQVSAPVSVPPGRATEQQQPSSERSASLDNNTTEPRSEHAAIPSDAVPPGALSSPVTGQSAVNRLFAKAEAYYKNKTSKSKLSIV